MRINLIYAKAANGVIGQHNTLPWHLPEDLAHFKRYTTGCPVVMGRATWESLPAAYRPLPGRSNWVLSRQAAQRQALQNQGAHACDSLAAALEQCQQRQPDTPEVWVIGGAQIYALALPLAQRVVVTEIHQTYAGDAYAPVLGPQWIEASRSAQTSAQGLRFDWVVYENHENV